MIIAVPFFAGKDARWYRLLEHWFECHAKSGTKVPAVVITDEFTLRDYPVLSVDTLPLSRQMRGHPWDRKGAIIAQAVQVLGRVLVCDLDAFIQRDPEPLLAKLPDVALMTRPDGWPPFSNVGPSTRDRKGLFSDSRTMAASLPKHSASWKSCRRSTRPGSA